MAALQCSVSPCKSILGFHRPVHRVDFPSITFLNLRPVPNAPPTYFTFRSKKNNVRLLLSQNLHRIYASNGSSEGSDVTKSNESKGPPFLTILAGFLVFFAVCWVIGLILTWLAGLIFRVPPK